MGMRNFSSKSRQAAHKCLELCGLHVIDPDMPARNCKLNIGDIVVSAVYYGANILGLWFAQIDMFVLWLNILCLILALIRTSIRQADCGKELLNIQHTDDNVKSVYYVPYKGLAMIEAFAFGADILALSLLFALNDPTAGVVRVLRGGVTLTIAITYLDGVMSNIQNMYQAYPRSVTLAEL